MTHNNIGHFDLEPFRAAARAMGIDPFAIATDDQDENHLVQPGDGNDLEEASHSDADSGL